MATTAHGGQATVTIQRVLSFSDGFASHESAWSAELSYQLAGQRRRTRIHFLGDSPASALDCLVLYLRNGGDARMLAGERIVAESEAAEAKRP